MIHHYACFFVSATHGKSGPGQLSSTGPCHRLIYNVGKTSIFAIAPLRLRLTKRQWRVVDANFTNTGELEDIKLIRTGMLATVAKHRIKLERDVKKGFATIMSQCSEGVRSKLEVSDGWNEV